jgi:hypothetical protein
LAGAETELAQLYEWLLSDNVPLIGIEGIGGTGKSTLASKVYDGSIPPTAESGQGQYSKRFWADVGEGATFEELAQQVLTAFDCPMPEQERQLVDVLVCCLQASPCLLVIDNLESLLNPERQWQGTSYEDFFNTWCECGSCSTIVITTRERPELRGVKWLPLHLKMGQPLTQIAQDYDLSLAALHAALSYYYDQQAEIEQSITAAETYAEEFRQTNPSPLQQN